ncbi:hypothetical protein HYW17_00155 [Candidatus Uhrbacteria bacterium]|nr:hypothetical protein [Candidatus Uhrbacteria bacterium]
MALVSFQEFFRTHFAGVQVRSLYLTIPVPQLGGILAARERETGELFAQARVASFIPGKAGFAESTRAIEDALRSSCGTLYKNVLISLPWARATQTDPVAFFHEYYARFAEASNVRQPNLDLAWMRATPREYFKALLRTLGRDPMDVYGAPNSERVDIHPTDPERGLVSAPPKVLAPREGEVPAHITYSLVPI